MIQYIYKKNKGNKNMTLQYAKEILEGYKQRLTESCSNQLDKDIKAFDLAIKALDGAIICMSEVEMRPYFEGYKAGKEDFEPPKGEWIDTGSGQECSVCHETQYGYDNFRHFCANCGADMRKGEKTNDL